MAFSVDVRCLPGQDGAEFWHFPQPPWGAGLRDDPRFRQVPCDETGSYRDYYAVLTTREALEINTHYLNAGLHHFRQSAEALQELLSKKTPSGLVVVHVYEWESGL